MSLPVPSPAPEIVCVGESMALITPTGAPLADADTATLTHAGAEANVAVGVAASGHRAAWASRLGDDPRGDRLAGELERRGVELWVERDGDAPTGVMFKDPGVESSAVYYYRRGSAASRMAPGFLDAARLEGVRIVHTTGITPALSATCLAMVDALYADARAAGATVSFDVNHRAALWDAATARAVYRRLLPEVDIVFAGADEAQLVLDQDAEPEQLARRLADLGPQQAVVKLGAEGCLAVIDGEQHTARGITIEPVDTVGAGDAFVGGYLAELAAGREPAERLATANAAGAFACLSPGDWEGLPRRSELGLLSATEPVIR
ncbi:MAG: sugar kinase [Microbacterium sp.]|nr:sugar kinase [Microbacterium sp.]